METSDIYWIIVVPVVATLVASFGKDIVLLVVRFEFLFYSGVLFITLGTYVQTSLESWYLCDSAKLLSASTKLLGHLIDYGLFFK